MVKIGRGYNYDRVIEMFAPSEDPESFRFMLCELCKRCLETNKILETYKLVFRNFKKHRVLFVRLSEIGLEQQT